MKMYLLIPDVNKDSVIYSSENICCFALNYIILTKVTIQVDSVRLDIVSVINDSAHDFKLGFH